jgi:hypothetical protein
LLWSEEIRFSKTDAAPATVSHLLPMERRPKLDVMNLESPPALKKQRKAAMKKAVGPVGPVASRVLSKYRARQTKLLGEYDDDPHPYSPTYIFYCLDSPNEKK